MGTSATQRISWVRTPKDAELDTYEETQLTGSPTTLCLLDARALRKILLSITVFSKTVEGVLGWDCAGVISLYLLTGQSLSLALHSADIKGSVLCVPEVFAE